MRPTSPYELLHYNMVHAHDTLKMGYDNILAHLDDPPLADLPNFMGYCHAWAVSIASHHDSEEAVVFPILNTKLDFSREIAQHKVIHERLDALLAFIASAKADPSKFDAAKMREMMFAFKDPLFQHLDDEVSHITSDKMTVFSKEEVLDLDAHLEAYAKTHGDPFLLVPFMRSHTPPELKDTWPVMSWVLRRVVVPWVLAVRHSGYWKYSPYGMS